MSEENKYELDDLVTSAVMQKPIDFEAAFDDLIVGRIRDAVEHKKIEIAQQMYGYDPEEYDEVGADESELEHSEEE